jgi:hypothetical protein
LPILTDPAKTGLVKYLGWQSVSLIPLASLLMCFILSFPAAAARESTGDGFYRLPVVFRKAAKKNVGKREVHQDIVLLRSLKKIPSFVNFVSLGEISHLS